MVAISLESVLSAKQIDTTTRMEKIDNPAGTRFIVLLS
jgi:hypothetical protein